MFAFEVIKKLENHPARKDKEQIIIDAYMQNCFEFFKGAQYACDQLISFGVKKVPLLEDNDLAPVAFDVFEQLLTKLMNRELTGHAARDAIESMASACDSDTWNYFYRRIILKDLRCGAETNTINKILTKMSEPNAEDLKIPVFSCQLAMDGNKDVNLKKLTGEKSLSLKLDGARLLTILNKEDGTVKQYSRVGHENTNFPQITEPLKQLLPIISESLVFDGEVVAKSFQDLMSSFGRKTKTENEAKLAVFDLIPLKDFKKGFCSIPQEKRSLMLSEFQTSGLFNNFNNIIYVLPHKIVNFDTEEGHIEFKKFINYAASLRINDKVIEGVMVKDLTAPYQGKRVDKWLKFKPFVSVSLEIYGVELGNKDGKYKDVIGNVLCKGTDEGVYIEVSVSSGITDDLRKEWLTNPPIGMIAEIEGDDFTLEEGSSIYSLRFPRFKGLRGFKPGEKI